MKPPHSGFMIVPQPPSTMVCGSCHKDIAKTYSKSLHGVAVDKKDPLAPKCETCHGNHYIKSHNDKSSNTFMLNIPFLCGKCHKEGAKVQQSRNIHQDHILENYSLSIHGEGLFKRGLTVTAVCNSCHTSHNVLPHTDPRSSISKNLVSHTCLKCHGQIENVHKKIINKELWQKDKHKIPVCVDCHQPHKIRRVFYEQGMSNNDCLKCHGKKENFEHKKSLYTDFNELGGSAHRDISCTQCHTGEASKAGRPCTTLKNKVDCSICHAKEVNDYNTSIHGIIAKNGDKDAPSCKDCHGDHGILNKRNASSPIFPSNIPNLCGKCHKEGARASGHNKSTQHNIVKNYSNSIHGKGLLESGLLVTATCISCHTAHKELPSADPESTVHKDNVSFTCGNCHDGVLREFQNSIHSRSVNKTDKKLPLCVDCHSSHTISRIDKNNFRLKIMKQCGDCHKEIADTYFDTYHGKVSKLGSAKTAKCHDCHGRHNILPPEDPKSILSRNNVVGTCGKCHPGSHRKFAGYLTHATHHDPEKYPLLFITFWGMTFLLITTFLVAGLHTLAWLPKSLKMMREHKKHSIKEKDSVQYRRFPSIVSKLHIMIIVSFFGLAITGMALKFSYAHWAVVISNTLGGFEAMGFIHRVCAVITFMYAGIHLWSLWKSKQEKKLSWKQFIFHKDSLMFNKRDLEEFIGTIKWFVGKGERPNYGRWSYWEKFDYFAVFWGVTIIGSSGLMLWFPEFFTYFLPAQLINVATIIHSDEALLAVGFIFTIHFFNTHFRPDKFPIDTVIFTGRMSIEELKRDKPREYEDWVNAGKPKYLTAGPAPDWYIRVVKIFGFTALFIGVSLVILIIYAMLFSYK